MRAISLHQPWASAVALGLKRIETRHWPTSYRGPLAIHAAATKLRKSREFWDLMPICDFQRFCPAGFPTFNSLPFGAIVGIVILRDCVPVETAGIPAGFAQRWGNFSAGRFAWVLDEVVYLAKPVPEIGRQRFWNWEPKPAATEYHRDPSAEGTEAAMTNREACDCPYNFGSPEGQQWLQAFEEAGGGGIDR